MYFCLLTTEIQYCSIIISLLHTWQHAIAILHVNCQSFLWKYYFHETRHDISTTRDVGFYTQHEMWHTTAYDLLHLHWYISFVWLCLLYSQIPPWPVTISTIKNIPYSLKCALLKCCLATRVYVFTVCCFHSCGLNLTHFCKLNNAW